MIGYARLIGAGIVLVLILSAWGFGRHQVTVKWERDKAIAQALLDVQAAETRRIENEWAVSKEQEREWKIKAESAGNDAAAVADRLRAYRARRCNVPETATVTGESGSSGAESSDVEGIERRHFRACALDAADYDTLRNRYNELRSAQ